MSVSELPPSPYQLPSTTNSPQSPQGASRAATAKKDVVNTAVKDISLGSSSQDALADAAKVYAKYYTAGNDSLNAHDFVDEIANDPDISEEDRHTFQNILSQPDLDNSWTSLTNRAVSDAQNLPDSVKNLTDDSGPTLDSTTAQNILKS